MPQADWDIERVPDHLRITFAVEDQQGRVVGSGKDLDTLREQLAGEVRRDVSRAGAGIERSGLTTWDLAELPRTWESELGGHTVLGYPTLVDEGASVALRVLPDPRVGRGRAAARGAPAPAPQHERAVEARARATDQRAEGRPGPQPARQRPGPARGLPRRSGRRHRGGARAGRRPRPGDFEAALSAVRTHVVARVLVVVEAVEPVLALAADVETLLTRMTAPAVAVTVADVRAQLRAGSLVRPGFVADTGLARLPHLRRYLRAIVHRLERAAESPARDATSQRHVDEVESAYADLLDALPAARRRADDVTEIAWMIEELRWVSSPSRSGPPTPCP